MRLLDLFGKKDYINLVFLGGNMNIKRNLRIFILFSQYALKSILLYPVGTILFTLGKIIRFLLFFFFVYFLVSKTSSLKGYTTDQAIIFYLTFNVIDTAAQLLFREVYRFRQLVVSGDLDGILLKPYHPFLRVLVGGIDPLDAGVLILYVILTLAFIIKLSATLSLVAIVMYFLLIVNAMVIGTAFHILVLAFGILTSNIDHGVMIYRDLTSVGRFPLEIYQEPFRWLITFVIPVGIMMSFPTQSLFGKLGINLTIVAFVLAGTFMYVSLRLWESALKKYQSWGG